MDVKKNNLDVKSGLIEAGTGAGEQCGCVMSELSRAADMRRSGGATGADGPVLLDKGDKGSETVVTIERRLTTVGTPRGGLQK